MILKGNETNTLPTIDYNELDGYVKISGRSVSLEIVAYFEEFLHYFEKYVEKTPSDLTINIDFEYFNTQTVRLMIRFLKFVKKVEEKGFKAKVNWFVEEDDEDMLDAGVDFKSVVDLNFNFIYKKPKE